MANELDPIVENWYCHLDKGQSFQVVAFDDDKKTVEVQNFDGDVTEFDMDTWRELEIEVCEAPENWAGAMDIGERDDYGTEITDTPDEAFTESLEEIHDKSK